MAPPRVQEFILNFGRANPDIKIEPRGLEEFRVIVRRLPADDLASWFGPLPDEEPNAKLGFDDLRPVFDSILRPAAPADSTMEEVAIGKIEANALSESVATHIRNGMMRTAGSKARSEFQEVTAVQR